MSSNETVAVNLEEVALPVIEENKQRRKIEEDTWQCFNNIDCQIYYAERLLQSFKEQYFDTSEEAFQKSEDAQRNFIYSHEFMAAQIWAISDILFDIRLKCEFADGLTESPIVKAHIEIENQMRSWLKKEGES